jgi:hypothetical protein
MVADSHPVAGPARAGSSFRAVTSSRRRGAGFGGGPRRPINRQSWPKPGSRRCQRTSAFISHGVGQPRVGADRQAGGASAREAGTRTENAPARVSARSAAANAAFPLSEARFSGSGAALAASALGGSARKQQGGLVFLDRGLREIPPHP